MIERLQLIATHLARFRLLIVVIALASLALLLVSLLENELITGSNFTIPALLTFSWASALYSLASLFASVPPKPMPTDHWRKRLSIRIRRAGLSVLALVVLTLSLALLLLTYQLLRTWSVS